MKQVPHKERVKWFLRLRNVRNCKGKRVELYVLI